MEIILEDLDAILWGFNITPEFLKKLTKDRVVNGVLSGISKIVKKGHGKVEI